METPFQYSMALAACAAKWLCILVPMKLKKNDTPPALEKGQLWVTDKGQVEIMDVGKTLAHYRMINNQKRTPTNLGPIQVVQEYLKSNGARLVKNERLTRARA
jgi:hypothetical protein